MALRWVCVQAAADGEALHGERLRLELQQQALKYERRIQELEVQGGGGSCSGGGVVRPRSPAGGRLVGVLDYIPRAEHVRLLEARLAAKEGDLQLEMGTRMAQASSCCRGKGEQGARAARVAGAVVLVLYQFPLVNSTPQHALSSLSMLMCACVCVSVLPLLQAEREAQWKLETKEQEIGSLTMRVRQVRGRASRALMAAGMASTTPESKPKELLPPSHSPSTCTYRASCAAHDTSLSLACI